MPFFSKYERAREWQKEQNQKLHPDDYNGEKLYETTIEEEMEKGDMFAMMISGFLTILPVCAFLLLLIVFIALLVFRLL
mgnify:CR=1 FL=1